MFYFLLNQTFHQASSVSKFFSKLEKKKFWRLISTDPSWNSRSLSSVSCRRKKKRCYGWKWKKSDWEKKISTDHFWAGIFGFFTTLIFLCVTGKYEEIFLTLFDFISSVLTQCFILPSFIYFIRDLGTRWVSRRRDLEKVQDHRR